MLKTYYRFFLFFAETRGVYISIISICILTLYIIVYL